MRSQLYARHDSIGGAPFLVSKEQATMLNTPDKGHGIYWTVNEFRGERKKQNLSNINSWYVDIDGDKPPLDEMLKRLHLLPSLVVESGNGYHIYWDCADATEKLYETIQKRLVQFYNADPNARDLARLLRAPGYFHLKNPRSPFLVKEVYSLGVKYSEKKQLFHLPPHIDEIKRQTQKFIQPTSYGDSFFDRIHNANQATLMLGISGKHFVDFQQYTLRRRYGGGYHIDVNGKAADAWIDTQGRIGSKANGGPSVWEWIAYFGQHSHQQIQQILQQEFPNL